MFIYIIIYINIYIYYIIYIMYISMNTYLYSIYIYIYTHVHFTTLYTLIILLRIKLYVNIHTCISYYSICVEISKCITENKDVWSIWENSLKYQWSSEVSAYVPDARLVFGGSSFQMERASWVWYWFPFPNIGLVNDDMLQSCQNVWNLSWMLKKHSLRESQYVLIVLLNEFVVASLDRRFVSSHHTKTCPTTTQFWSEPRCFEIHTAYH